MLMFASTDCGLGCRIHPQVAWAKARGTCGGREAREPWALAI